MKRSHFFSRNFLAAGLAAVVAALPFLLYAAERAEPARGGGGEPAHIGGGQPAHIAPASRPAPVQRVNHGTVRHVEPPAPVERRAPPSIRPPNRVPPRAFRPGDPQVDVHRDWGWRHFSYGRRWSALPSGCFTIVVGGASFYCGDGVFYQPVDGGYQEVYPPDGAVLPELPDGAVEIDGPDQTYYYVDGAFYVEVGNGYQIVQAPIGVIVPELPPGAAQLIINGQVEYQFNGTNYLPVFVNGVTQYQSVAP